MAWHVAFVHFHPILAMIVIVVARHAVQTSVARIAPHR
jgi:hypothetical protein